MPTCPTCGRPDPGPACEVERCYNAAKWEGWYRNRDFAGVPTGMMSRRSVCNEHKHRLGMGVNNG